MRSLSVFLPVILSERFLFATCFGLVTRLGLIYEIDCLITIKRLRAQVQQFFLRQWLSVQIDEVDKVILSSIHLSV
jgi:hypothetical protein